MSTFHKKEADFLIKMIIKELDNSKVKGFILPTKTKNEFLLKLLKLMTTNLDISQNTSISTLLDKSFQEYYDNLYPDFDGWYYLFCHSYGSYKKYATSIYLEHAILNFRSSLN